MKWGWKALLAAAGGAALNAFAQAGTAVFTGAGLKAAALGALVAGGTTALAYLLQSPLLQTAPRPSPAEESQAK